MLGYKTQINGNGFIVLWLKHKLLTWSFSYTILLYNFTIHVTEAIYKEGVRLQINAMTMA